MQKGTILIIIMAGSLSQNSQLSWIPWFILTVPWFSLFFFFAISAISPFFRRAFRDFFLAVLDGNCQHSLQYDLYRPKHFNYIYCQILEETKCDKADRYQDGNHDSCPCQLLQSRVWQPLAEVLMLSTPSPVTVTLWMTACVPSKTQTLQCTI